MSSAKPTMSLVGKMIPTKVGGEIVDRFRIDDYVAGGKLVESLDDKRYRY